MFDIPSVFPQRMDETHRKILQRNQDYLEKNLCISRTFCAQLVQHGVLNNSMVDELGLPEDELQVC